MKRLPCLTAAVLVGLLAIGCNTQNAEPPEPEQKASGMASQEMPPEHPPVGEMPAGHPAVGQQGPAITGTISLAPELVEKASPGAVLYVIARQQGVNAPVAVARLQDVTFPAAYSLSRQHMMGSQGTGGEKVEVTARLDKDGMVGPPEPGDIEGIYPNNPVAMGESGVDFILDKIH